MPGCSSPRRLASGFPIISDPSRAQLRSDQIRSVCRFLKTQIKQTNQTHRIHSVVHSFTRTNTLRTHSSKQAIHTEVEVHPAPLKRTTRKGSWDNKWAIQWYSDPAWPKCRSRIPFTLFLQFCYSKIRQLNT